jgi:hypothetical protein
VNSTQREMGASVLERLLPAPPLSMDHCSLCLALTVTVAASDGWQRQSAQRSGYQTEGGCARDARTRGLRTRAWIQSCATRR